MVFQISKAVIKNLLQMRKLPFLKRIAKVQTYVQHKTHFT